MAGGSIKSEFSPDSIKMESAITPELKAEITHMLQAAMSEFRAESVVKPHAVEAERKKLDDTAAALRVELANARKQAQDTFLLMNSFKSQLDSQAASYDAQIQQFEQKIAALNERDTSLRTSHAQISADRNVAVQLQKQLMLSNDQLTNRNHHLSTKLSDVQSEYAIKVAELNDITYARNQLKQRLLQATKENDYWRQYYSASASTQGGPPTSVYFSVPQMPNRRNTVPDISSAPQRYGPFTQADPTEPRGQKRPRLDSVSSNGSIDVSPPPSALSLPSASPTSATFQLRPVRPPKSLHSPVESLHPPIASEPDLSPTRATGATLITLPRLSIPAPPALVPPTAVAAELAPVQQGPQPAPQSSLYQPSPVTESTKEPISPSRMLPPHVRQMLQQLFPVSATGQRECKLCKTRPEGVVGMPVLTSSSPADCLAHAKKYHSKILAVIKDRASQSA
ncbi:hypothetical protein FRC07_004729 [Ceratobasidium sp. 392]|nr:hypothetical protein FRC07_004729 [Ceratobasidium sp. 392]